ncbi:MAG: alpha/beta hydrolase [Rubrivivax sp. SCN 70-15]|nr:MAG: alpha/beta hydrolase [Rubrivivax sp. SCN 70-15]
MNPRTRALAVAGPAGKLEAALDAPEGATLGLALLCHPHPLHGGTMDNKVVQTMARAVVACGWRALRFNFRGVGASEGAWDEGRGEVDDALAVIDALREPGLPLALGGFSFGACVAAQVAARLPAGDRDGPLVLIAPAVTNFFVPAVSQPCLVVHGEADDVVALAAVLDWARPQALPVTVVPGAGHFFHGQLPLLKQLVAAAWHR